MNLSLTRSPLFTLAAIALSGSLALAQQPAAPPDNATPAAAPVERHAPPPPRGSGMAQNMRPGMMHGGMQPTARGQMERGHEFRGADRGAMGGGDFHIGPTGMWWKNPAIVQKLTLTADQTKKMDDIFQQSRLQLIDLKANVEKQQILLEPLISANPVDTTKAMAQIDKVAQSRADLEKADAKMLLGIRAVLSADQWTKLRDRGPGGPGGQAGPAGQAGPGGGDRTRGMRGGGGPSPNNSSNRVEPIDLP